ncbi:hypothetical protein M8818_004538 [Zalaria obscura]|uniref:Uncharacterized protein n=1 Tax=Zalaria obscura TaxID=2024903 RepID=A0ACC3SFR9_9PEZI
MLLQSTPPGHIVHRTRERLEYGSHLAPDWVILEDALSFKIVYPDRRLKGVRSKQPPVCCSVARPEQGNRYQKEVRKETRDLTSTKSAVELRTFTVAAAPVRDHAAPTKLLTKRHAKYMLLSTSLVGRCRGREITHLILSFDSALIRKGHEEIDIGA